MNETLSTGGRPGPKPASRGSTKALTTCVVLATVVAALYFGRPVLMPLALAVLLAFALGPLVRLLRHWHFGSIPSVIAAVALAIGLVGGVGSIIGSQIANLTEQLPQYQTNIKTKVQSALGAAVDAGIIARTSSLLRALSEEIARTTEGASPAITANGQRSVAEERPVPVEIRDTSPLPLRVLRNIVGPLLEPLAMTGIVMVFLFFILMNKEDLHDRLAKLVGGRDFHRTTIALDDGAGRLSRYLLVETAINAGFGVISGLGLWVIGVPNPLLWGLIAMVARFVPYIGAWIAASFPAMLALAVDPGWSMFFWTIGLFLVVEPLIAQVIEPWLYGQSAGLSPIAVVVSATFWTMLWGPVGLLLSMPLTLGLVVLGRHVEQLKFLEVLLGDTPALAMGESFYLRMLAEDPDQIADQAEDYLKEKPLLSYYDEVVLPGLLLAQIDVNRGLLDHQRQRDIERTISGLVQNLSDHEDADTVQVTPVSAFASEDLVPEWRNSAVLCVAGRNPLDEAVTVLLADLLQRQGLKTRRVPSDDATAVSVGKIDLAGIGAVCVSYLDPGTHTSARFLVRRLRRRAAGTKVLIGFWSLANDNTGYLNAVSATNGEHIVTSLGDALAQLIGMAKGLPRAAQSTKSQSEGTEVIPFPLSMPEHG